METIPDIYFEWGFNEMGFLYRMPITWKDNADGFWFEDGVKEFTIPVNLN